MKIPDDCPLDEAWMREIERRSKELDAGLVKTSPWEEVLKRVREKYRKRSRKISRQSTIPPPAE